MSRLSRISSRKSGYARLAGLRSFDGKVKARGAMSSEQASSEAHVIHIREPDGTEKLGALYWPLGGADRWLERLPH